ncbi:MAG: DUF2087 domain-containing protein [Propionibacteriaceae bacterium]|jgi:hypothetical protein|nr:DUF2087 domain-containing protein [Propionibacteriaceae bacterium]
MSQIPDSIARFFTTEGQLRTVPAKAAPREAVLTWLTSEVMRQGETLDEPTLNLRLRRFHLDAAMLRRYMIEQGLLVRDPSGANYRLPEDSGSANNS